MSLDHLHMGGDFAIRINSHVHELVDVQIIAAAWSRHDEAVCKREFAHPAGCIGFKPVTARHLIFIASQQPYAADAGIVKLRVNMNAAVLIICNTENSVDITGDSNQFARTGCTGQEDSGVDRYLRLGDDFRLGGRRQEKDCCGKNQ